ncbi:Hypothetical predicted protein [Pelobates cultripes]|uniref:DDE-1 domain-containing protein n=1 Tax=Pelobates cultripes TaxID=61616 RepID=A0AAD1WXA0_PELCU|nr:Hypothetical predicted protein [Pelobates cultripes]
MLLMDNAPAHPPGLEEDLVEDFNFIKVTFLPPYTTLLLQPISNFKKLYTREHFRRCFEMTDRSSLTHHEFWREHFDIVSCLQIITIAIVSHLHQSQQFCRKLFPWGGLWAWR